MRPGKHVLVWAVALMMIANPASACRWRARSYCGPAYGTHYVGYSDSCGGFSDCGVSYESDCGAVVESGCDSGCGTVVDSGCSGCQVSGEDVTTNHAPDGVPVEAETPQPTFESDVPSAAPPAPSAPAAVPPAPAPAQPVPAAPRAVPPAPAPAPATRATPAPAQAPAAQPEVEDLFNQPAPTPTPTPETKPAEPAEVEDLFKDPEPAPAAAPEKPSENVDDLFKDLEDNKENKAAASETPAEQPSEGELEDLFSDPKPAEPMATTAPVAAPAVVEAQTSEPAGMRVWTDNTGKFQIRGRLVTVTKTHVRLLKENGKFTTVPYTRLSQTDLAFVRSQGAPAVVANF